MKKAKLKALLGQTCVNVVQIEDREILFKVGGGVQYLLHHQQDCCEDVHIESVAGDLADLVGEPILVAEEVVHEDAPPEIALKRRLEPPADEYNDSETWTFYKFATRKGYVDVRWYGSSNGYYSERVCFSRVDDEDDD